MNLQIVPRLKENGGTIALIIAGLVALYVFWPVAESIITIGAIGIIAYFGYTRWDDIKNYL